MTQEVQVTITLEVDALKSKEDIKAFILDMEQTYTRTVSDRNRWEFSKFTVTDIKEESEIYGTDEEAVNQQPIPDEPVNTDPEAVAYEEGRQAWAAFEANNGKMVKGNTYPSGSIENAAWNRGFNVG